MDHNSCILCHIIVMNDVCNQIYYSNSNTLLWLLFVTATFWRSAILMQDAVRTSQIRIGYAYLVKV